MRRVHRSIPALTLLLLLAFGGVSFGGVRVGGSGGGAVGYWEHQSSCASSLTRTRSFDQVPHGQVHVDVDIPDAPGLRLGGAAGFRLITSLDESESFDSVQGIWNPTSSTSLRIRKQLLWTGGTLAIRKPWFELEGMVGLAQSRVLFAQGDGSEAIPQVASLRGVATLRVAGGAMDTVGVEFRTRVWGEFDATELGASLALRVLGGEDRPALWAGVDFGAGVWEPEVTFVAGMTPGWGWRVQPFVQGRIGGPRRWAVEAGVSVAIGKQPGPLSTRAHREATAEREQIETEDNLPHDWVNPDEPSSAVLAAPNAPAAKAQFAFAHLADLTVMEYLVVLPKNHDEDVPHPALLVLPLGDQGRTMAQEVIRPWRPELDKGWIVVVPVAAPGENFTDANSARVPLLLHLLSSEFKVQGDKWHLLGVGEGGASAFAVAADAPDAFHSLTVIPGAPHGFDAWRRAQLLGLPMTLVVGGDDIAAKNASRDAASRLRAQGAEVELVVLPGESRYAFLSVPWADLKRWLRKR